MLIIPIKEGESIERALKQFKRKFDRTQKMKQLRNRKHYIKPTIARRNVRIKAAYVQRKKTMQENM